MNAMSGSRYALWILLPLAAALCSSLASKHVADTQRAIITAKRHIAADLMEIRRLRGELSARARPATLEQVNEQSLGLAAPSADRYFHDVYALVGFAGDVDHPPAPAVPATAGWPALADAGAPLVHRTAFNGSFGADVPLQPAPDVSAPLRVETGVALQQASVPAAPVMHVVEVATSAARPQPERFAVTQVRALAPVPGRTDRPAQSARQPSPSQPRPLLQAVEHKVSAAPPPSATTMRLDAGALAAIRASVTIRP